MHGVVCCVAQSSQEIAMSIAPETTPVVTPEAMLRVPVGLASPLWGLFAGAAVTGAAWWWMTRWTQTANLEAMFAAPATAEELVETEVAALAAPLVEAVIEASPEPVLDPIAEATPEPIVEAMVEVMPEPMMKAAAEVVPQPAIDPVVEAMLGPVADSSVETAPEPVLEAVTEPAPVPEAAPPVVIEAPAVVAKLKTKTPTAPKTA